jgi:hypothetical protein
MKPLIIAAAAAFTLTFAQAQDCKGLGDLAEKVMELRQAGGALSDIMSNPELSSLTKRMAVDAYKTPRYSTEEVQRRAVTDFRADWEVACYEVRSKKKGGSNV